MPTVDDYNAWKQRENSQSAAQTGFTLGEASKVNPDEFAADVKLGKAFGINADVANAGREILNGRLTALKNSVTLRNAPRTTQWLRDADNARAAWDDVENLTWFERAGEAATMGNATLITQGQEYTRDASGVLERGPLGRTLDAARDTFDNAFLTNSDGTPNFFGRLANYAREQGMESDGVPRQMVGGKEVTPDERAAAIFSQQMGPIYQGAKALLTQMESEGFQPMSYKDVDGLGSAAAFVSENVAMSMPQWASALASGGFAPFIRLVAQAGSVNAELAEKSPHLTPEQRVAAATAAGTVMSVLETIGMEKVFGATPLGKIAEEALSNTLVGRVVASGGSSAFGRLLTAAITEGGTEVLQEAITVGTGAATGGQYTSEEVVDRFLQSFFAGAGAGGGLRGVSEASGGTARIAKRLLDDSNKAAQAEQTQTVINDLGDNAASSKLRTRLDGSFMDFVGRATEGTPIEDIFVPAAKLQELFQSYRFDPKEFLSELPGVDFQDWETAVATAGDVKIPTATYAAKLAGSDIDPFLRENMRFSPDDMTFSEARDFNAQAREIQMQAFEEAEASRVAEEQERAVELQELDEMIGRLRAAGRSTDVARYEAMPIVAMRKTMAGLAGMTPEQFAAQNPLPEVRGEIPEGLKPKNVDALNRQLAEMRSFQPPTENNGPSLLEAISDYGGINDVGGELRSRDAAVVKRGRGKKTLRLARGGVVSGMKDMFGGANGKKHGIDDVAQAMIEAGYLQDSAIANEYRAALENGTEVPDISKALLEAIDEELRGNVQYSGTPVVDERSAALERNIAYLNELGVSLDDGDDAIRSALEKAGQESGRVLGQATLRQKLAKLQKAMADLVTFAKSAERGQSQSVEIAQVSEAVADLVEQQAGIDIHGYRHVIDSSAVRHIIKNHGDEKSETKRGMVAITDTDLADIPSLISNADKIVTGAKGKRGEDLIGYLKKLDDGTTLYIEEARRGKKVLAAVSMRKYPATSDYSSIAKTISPNVQDDGGIAITITDVPANSKTLFQSNRSTALATDTDAFKDWFGESKVVDAGGKPIVAYHGSSENFEAFDPSKSRDGGFWFTPEKEYASFWGSKADGGNVTPVYLSIQNPAYEDNFAYRMSEPTLFGKLFGKKAEREGAFTPEERAAKIEELREAGFDGVIDSKMNVYIAFDPSQIKSVNNRGTFDGSDARILYQGSDGRRGSIQLPLGGASDSPVIISLFESADLSTFIHESGHYFLNTLEDLRTASPDIQAMHDNVRGWWSENADAVAVDAKAATGVEVNADHVKTYIDNGTTGDVTIDTAIETGMHEQFARGFEAYLLEGKAPSIELRSAFERFTQWLVRLYKNIRGLNVRLSPEMRGVFDRMLATDAEIEAARSDMSDEMLFAAAEAAGLNPEDYRQLVKLHDQSVEAANEKLRREVMAPIKRETEKWYREEKARVREEVGEQVNRQPVYRAWEWLGNRRWLDGEVPEGMPDMRFNRDMLVSRYGEGVLQTLPRSKFTLYANEGGLDPDEVAGWFGFDSGDSLIKALEQAPVRREAIEAETDRVMRERHGDVLRDGQIEERAIEALHNDKRAQFLAAELKVLKDRAGDTSVDMTVAQAREAARLTINRMKVRDAVSSNRFLTAERKAANEAVKLARLVERENLWSRQQRRGVQAAVKGGSLRATNTATDRANASTDRYNDAVALLVDQKRKQLLNHMLYSESMKAAEEVEKAERYVAKLGKKSTRGALAGDYLEAIDELLSRYDFRKLSARDEDRRGSLLNYIARMTADGRENEISIPDDVIQNAQRRPYKQLSVDEMRGVIDSLKNIEHTARLKQRLKDAKRERELDAVVDDIMSEFDENVKGKAPARAKSGRGGAKEGFRSYLNLVKTADTILREIDGFADGAAYRHIKAPIDEAVNDLTIKRREAGEKFEELYSVYTKQERRNMTTLQSIPELNGQFSKWDLISIALNMGNEGNYQRMTDNRVKGHFTPGQLEMAVSRLDERDWKFVQSAWDLIDGYWPDIEAREKRVTGVAPEKIAPREVTTKFGTFKGGYYPLKYDAEISSLARDDDLNDLAASMTGGRFGKAQTKNGHTKERSNSSGRPVLIDIGVLHGHVNQVIHDLALSEVVANSWRIIQNNDVKNAFLDNGMKSDFDALEVWLQDVASGEVRGADFMNRWARKMKSGFTVSVLAFNVVTALLQPSGLAQSAVVVGKKNLLLGMQDVFRRPLSGPASAASMIIEKSPFMQERETTFNKDIYDVLGETRTGPTRNRVTEFASDYIAPLGFWLMQKTQFYTVDMPTWLAGYRQAVDQGKSEADAIAHADRVVARAAASGNFSDRTPIERGSLSRNVRQNDVVRLFTALGSYMFAKFNVAYEQTRQTEFTDPRQVLSWAADMTMLFTVEAVLTALVRGQLPLDDEDEDEDGWLEFLAKQTAMSVASTLPFIRDVSSGVQGFNGGGTYGSIVNILAQPFFQASQGEIDKAFIRSLINVAGLFAHMPSVTTNRVVDATWRQAEGEEVSPIEYIMGKSK